MIILRYLLLYVIIISGAIFIADKFNKKLEKTIPLNLIIIIVTLYLFGICNLLYQGVIAIGTVNILLFVYTIIKNIKNKTM